MKNVITTMLAILSLNIIAFAQQAEQPQTFGISVSGYIKSDVFYDSHQFVKAREGEFELYPAPRSLDASGKDVNAIGNFNMLAVQSRLTGKVTVPDVLGAKSTGVLEGEFFGTSDADVNGFRLRLAYVNLNWNNSTQLLIGQAWNPLFILDAFPGSISYNTGIPFKTLSRNPQIKLTQSLSSNVTVSLAVLTERDFQSCGPAGNGTASAATNLASTSSSSFAQDAIIPNTDLQIKFKNDNFLFALTGDYKVLEPLQSVSKGTAASLVQTTEKINSMIGQVTTKYSVNDFSITAEGVYAQNPVSQFLIGGYAIKSIDAVSGIPTYTNFNTASFWTDIVCGSKFQVGLFAGYTQNLGTSDAVTTASLYAYGRGTNIKDIYRVSPRVIFNYGKTRFGLEVEYTAADYGTNDSNNNEKVINTYNVSGLRVLLGTYIFF